MHFDFLRELFSEYSVDICVNEDTEIVTIRNDGFDFPIVVYYFPDDYHKYLLRFATQHRDTSSKDDLISYISSFEKAEKAAIEFYKDGKDCFGGEIETAVLNGLTYDSLKHRFFYHDLADYMFSVRAWDKSFCFDAHFAKDDFGHVTIVKNYVS